MAQGADRTRPREKGCSQNGEMSVLKVFFAQCVVVLYIHIDTHIYIYTYVYIYIYLLPGDLELPLLKQVVFGCIIFRRNPKAPSWFWALTK